MKTSTFIIYYVMTGIILLVVWLFFSGEAQYLIRTNTTGFMNFGAGLLFGLYFFGSVIGMIIYGIIFGFNQAMKKNSMKHDFKTYVLYSTIISAVIATFGLIFCPAQ